MLLEEPIARNSVQKKTIRRGYCLRSITSITLPIRRVPVLNRDKRLVGIVSLGDLSVETQDQHLAGKTLEGISEPGKPNR
jgi:hypothetical protein